MSLRLRLIGLVAIVLAASLALGGSIAVVNASRSVDTEMNSALAVARQTIEARIAGLAVAETALHDLEQVVSAFRGNRHLRVTLSGGDATVASPPVEAPPLGDVPRWFARLVGVAPKVERVPIVIDGRGLGAVVIETVPHNEIVEIWNEFGDSLLVLALFSGPTILLIYFFIGRALRPLERLAAGLSALGESDYGVRVEGRLPPELSGLRDNFNRTSARLAEMAAENDRLNEELLTLQERERTDLARDLHDEVGPFLFAINVDAAAISRHVDAGRLAPIKTHLHAIVDAVDHMQRQVKDMLGRLRPIGLAEFGLAEAIGNLIAFWQRRHPDIAFTARIAVEATGFGDLINTTIFRIVQESLSNAIRHGQPKTVEVSVTCAPHALEGRGEVTVEILDDGRGLTPPGTFGYGLTGMGERVRALGGRFELTTAADQGLKVTAVLPLARPNSRASSTEPVLS